jgi:SAM-dependent methyltransferase
VAQRGFGSTVEAYRRGRPSYPPEAVNWLVAGLRLGPGRTVVDVGAGTGKFSALLIPSGVQVVAVEPLAAMREGFAAELPGVKVLEGSAEALPLPDGSADAIVAAQAFHWLNLERALPEFARVLSTAGRLGVIWNDLDVSVPWVAEFNKVIGKPRVGTPLPSEAGQAELGPWFGLRTRAKFTHLHEHDRASLLDRVNSMSFVAVLPTVERAEILERIGALVDSHPQLAGRETFDLPYVTEAFWAERPGVTR